MKYIILLLLSLNLFAINPSDYSTFKDYNNALEQDNPNWLENPTDVVNVINKDIVSNEVVSAKTLNSKLNALNKKADLVIKTKNKKFNKALFSHGKSTNAYVASFDCPKNGNYAFSVLIYGPDTTPKPYLHKNGSQIAEGGAGGYSGYLDKTTSCIVGDSYSIRFTAGGGGTSVSGFYSFVEVE